MKNNKTDNNIVYNIDKYINTSDEQLLELINNNDEQALEYLLNKYKYLIRKKARTYFLIGADNDDIIQEGMIGLYKAIRDFNKDKKTSFITFAELCVTRQMISAVKASTRMKHTPLNSYISLSKPSFYEDNTKFALIEHLPSNKIINPEELLINKENLNMIKYELDKKLSNLEKEVFTLYLDGLTYIDIANKMNRPIKSIDNALQRIKRKVENIVNLKQA